MREDLSDEELMLMYQNGKEEAFIALYRRHSGKIYGYVKSKVKSQEKAADIFQEIFIKIHRSKDLYRRDFPVLPWFFTIARSVLIDETRKERPLVLVSDEQLSEKPAPALVQNEVLPAAELARLPEAQRAAVQMRYVDEKTFAEIADYLNTSEQNVRQLVSRGIKKLRSLLASGESHE